MINHKKMNCILEKLNDNNNDNEKDFQLIFEDICHEFYIDKFALAIFSGKKNILESFSIYDTYPEEWMIRYKEENYHLYDPVFTNLNKIALPFEWDSKKFKNLLPIQKKLLEEAQDFGIKSGVTIPLIPHPHFQGFVTLLNQPPLHPEVLSTISLTANACADKIIATNERQIIESLTDRERRILTLKLAGEPIKVISQELDLSQPTIILHLKYIREKLDVVSTEQALIKFGTALSVI